MPRKDAFHTAGKRKDTDLELSTHDHFTGSQRVRCDRVTKQQYMTIRPLLDFGYPRGGLGLGLKRKGRRATVKRN